MNELIRARFSRHKTKSLETLYYQLLSTLSQPSTNFDHVKHDLELWLKPHSFEKQPYALEYYLVNPNSALNANLPI